MGRHRQTYTSLLRHAKYEGNCLIFQGCKDKDGYGLSSIKGVKMPAHRAAWILGKGVQLNTQEYVLHTCGNRACIDLDHLYVGTQKQNVQDQKNAGTFVEGENSGSAILTKDNVLEIRTKELSIREYATKFNVSYHTVWDVSNHRSWRSI